MSTRGDAGLVATLLAEAAPRFGGVHLRAGATSGRAAWLDALRAGLPPGTPWLRIPANASADTLLGGLDLAATLASGRPQTREGLLARAHGGVLVLGMAERAAPLTLALLQQALDQGQVQVERQGMRSAAPARFALIVLDEGREEYSTLPPGLLDRLSFSLDEPALEAWRQAERDLSLDEEDALRDLAAQLGHAGAQGGRGAPPAGEPATGVSGAVNHPASGSDSSAKPVPAAAAALEALCASAWQLGIDSLRAPIQALAVAQSCALLAGRALPAEEDLVTAGRLVFAARAVHRPAPPVEDPPPETAADATPPEDGPPPDAAQQDSAPPPADAPPPQGAAAPEPPDHDQSAPPPPTSQTPPRTDEIIDSLFAGLPADLLERLAPRLEGQGSGRVAAVQARRARPVHGRPVGSRPGDPRHGLPLDLLATLRSALPWQKLRASRRPGGARLSVRASDLQVRNLKPRTRSTAVFAVDASGSAALNRLNEAKGAVESLLAQCYVRRDQVALISFRGAGAQVLLQPTRALARVRRELCALPGGGGTPLASGLELAGKMTAELRRRGDAPLLVVLTDGRANVSRDGIGGRARAEQEAFAQASVLRQQSLPILLVDIAPQPQERARLLARSLGAEYLALPAASAERLSAAVEARMPSRAGSRHG